MKQTPNLGLNKPELTDVVNIEDLNQNFDTIDSEIKSAKDKADQAFQSASDGKSKIATAITGKGVPTSSSDTFQAMATNINSIETDKTGDATAVVGDILSTKTAYAKGVKLIGTMPNNGSVGTKNLATEGAEYTIPAGYHNGLGKVKAVITGLIASVIKTGTTVGGILGTFTSDADASPHHVLKDVSAYAKGNKIIGTMPNRDYAWHPPVTIGADHGVLYVVPPQGWYAGNADLHVRGGVSITDPKFIPSNIPAGISMFGLVGTKPNGRGFATGTASPVTHSSNLAYAYRQQTVTNDRLTTTNKVVVSGLTFTPRLIYIISSGYPVCMYSADLNAAYNNIQFEKDISHNNWTKTNTVFYVNSTGFCLPVQTVTNTYVNWYAFE